VSNYVGVRSYVYPNLSEETSGESHPDQGLEFTVSSVLFSVRRVLSALAADSCTGLYSVNVDNAYQMQDSYEPPDLGHLFLFEIYMWYLIYHSFLNQLEEAWIRSSSNRNKSTSPIPG